MKFRKYYEQHDMVHLNVDNKTEYSNCKVNTYNYFAITFMSKWILILCGIIPMLLTINEIFMPSLMSMNVFMVVLFSTFIVGAFAVIMYSGINRHCMAVYVVIIVILAYIFKEEILWGITTLGNNIIQLIEEYYNINIKYSFPISTTFGGGSIDVIGVVIASSAGIILIISTWKRIILIPHIIIEALIIVLALNVGYTPQGMALILYLVYSFAIVIMNNAQTDNKYLSVQNQIYVGIVNVLIVSILITCVSATIHESAYGIDETIEKRKKINAVIMDVVEFFKEDGKTPNSQTTTGTTNQTFIQNKNIKMGGTDGVDYNGNVDLIATFSDLTPRNYYFRAFGRQHYENNEWKSSVGRGWTTPYNALLNIHNMPINALNRIKTNDKYSKKLYEVDVQVQLESIRSEYELIPSYVLRENENSILDDSMVLFSNELNAPIYSSDFPIIYDQRTSAITAENESQSYKFSVLGFNKYSDIFEDYEKVKEIIAIEYERYEETLSSEAQVEAYNIVGCRSYNEKHVYKEYIQIPTALCGIDSEFQKEFGDITLTYKDKKYDLSDGTLHYKTIGLQPYIDYVTEYLSHMKYTLSPGKTPEGKEFVENFLFDTKQGYCTYFATAATMMFRQMGVPARYVEGYVVKQSDFSKNVASKTDDGISIEVKNENAHAWVEIYEQNFGWIPVEVTVGTNADFQQETKEKTTQKTTEKTTEKKTKTKETTPEQTTSSKDGNTGKENELNNTQSPMQKIPWKVIIIILVVMLIPVLIRYLVLKRRSMVIERRLRQLNVTKLNKQLSKLFAIYDIKLKEGCTNEQIATLVSQKLGAQLYEPIYTVYSYMDKYIYSKKSLTIEELKQFNIVMIKTIKQISKEMNLITKMKIKYFWCLY